MHCGVAGLPAMPVFGICDLLAPKLPFVAEDRWSYVSSTSSNQAPAFDQVRKLESQALKRIINSYYAK
jgi:hypothetical protein